MHTFFECFHNLVKNREGHRISVFTCVFGPNVILMVQLTPAESVITLYESVHGVCVKVAVL